MQRKFYKLVLFIFSFLLAVDEIRAQSGNLNTAFGENGLLQQPFLPDGNAFNEVATGIVHLDDGKSVLSILVNNKTVLTRILADGSIDKSFGKDGYSESVRISGNPVLAAAQDGSFYVASGFYTVAHIYADGTVDKSYGVNGLTAPSFPSGGIFLPTMAIQADGKVVLAGGLQQTGNTNIAVVRFNTNGRIDSSFGIGGKVITDFGVQDYASAIAIQPDGKIVIGGLTGSGTSFSTLSLVRYHPDGQLDVVFGKGGRVVTSPGLTQTAQAVKIQPDGKILLAASSNLFHVFRYQYDGTPDLSFGSNGMAVDGFFPLPAQLRSMELLPDGRILVAGEINSNPAVSKREIGLIQFDAGGFLYKPFGSSGKSTVWYGPYLNSVRAMKVRDDGKIMIAGAWQPSNGPVGDYAIVLCMPEGFLDPSFGNSGQVVRMIQGEVSSFRAIVLQNDKIIAGGAISVNNESDLVFARYYADGSLDESFGDQGKIISNIGLAEVVSALQVLPDRKILAAGTVRSANGSSDLIFARYFENGTIDPSFGVAGKAVSVISPTSDIINAMAVQPDGKFLVAGLISSTQNSMSLLARYNPDGSLDNTFAQGGTSISNFGYPSAILNGVQVLADGKVVALGRGIYPTGQGGTDIILAQYHPDGSPDASFGNGGVVISNLALNDVGQQLIVEPNGNITVAGTLDAVGNNGDFAIFRFHADGTPDASFGDNGKSTATSTTHDIAESFVMQEDGKYVLTGQTINVPGTNAATHLLLVRFNANGSIDQSFGLNGRVSANVDGDEVLNRSVIVGENIYLAGSINDIGTSASIISFRLNFPVQLTCPTDVVTTTDKGICAALISGIDPVITPVGSPHVVQYSLVGGTNASDTGSVSGMYFNKGVTTVTYALDKDPSKTCNFKVTVNDTEYPRITVAPVTSAALWPVDHKMRDIELVYEMTDNCGVADSSISISSNEPNRKSEADWEIINNRFIRLRAERDGRGDGRIYTVTLTAKDGSGHTTVQTILFTVPKSQASITDLQRQGLRSQSLELPSTTTSLQVKLLSNPTTSHFTLQVNGTEADEKVSMRITNTLGILIEKIDNVNSRENISFGAGYKPGVYYVEIINGNQRKQFRVLKQ